MRSPNRPGVYDRLVNYTEVANRLRHYRDIERRWADDLYELDQHATYRLLAAGDMSGRTGKEANAVVEAAPFLWGWMREVRATLDEVERIQTDRGVFGSKNTDQTTTLLEGPAIELLRVEIPKSVHSHLQQQLIDSTVDPATTLVTLDTLVALFRSVYEPVRDVVSLVDAVWRDIMPRINAAEVSLAKAEAIAKRVDSTVPEVRLAQQRLGAVKATVADDPLSLASNVGENLDVLVADAVRAADALDRSFGNLDADTDASSVVLADLRVLRARAAAAYSEAEAKVTSTTALKRVPSTAVIDGPNGLAHRAARLADADGPWQDRRRELDRWHATAERLRTQLSAALETNSSSIVDRNEMRGLLRAYRSKAAMMPDLPDEVIELGDLAHHELYTSPTDLDRARELIAEFSQRLSA